MIILIAASILRVWWNRNTQRMSNQSVEIPYEFKSHHSHQYGSIVQWTVHGTSNPRIKVRLLVGSPKYAPVTQLVRVVFLNLIT